MKIENDKIIEATVTELYRKWLDEGWEESVTFPDYLYHMEHVCGVEVTHDMVIH